MAEGNTAQAPQAPAPDGAVPEAADAPGPPGPVMPPLAGTGTRVSMLIGRRRGWVAMIGICSALSGITEAAILALLVEIATSAAKHSGGRASTKIDFAHLHLSPSTLFILTFVLVLARIALYVPLSVLPARVAADVQSRLRRELFAVFTRASWEVQANDREGYLQETMTGQVAQATGGALQTTQLVISSFTFLALMVSAVVLNAVAAVVILITATAIFALLRPLNRLAVRLARALSRAQIEYAGGVSEAGRVAEETQVFGVGEAQLERIDRFIGIAQNLFYRSSLVGRISPGLYQSAIYLLLIGGLAALYYGGGNFAALGAVIIVILRAGQFGQQAQGSYQGLRSSLPFVDRIRDTARRYAESTPVDGDRELPVVETIGFDGVSFAYRAGRPVLSEVNFEVDAGEAVGIIGPSGAGKSTLFQILLQLRVPGGGTYVVNGEPVQGFRREDWHRRVAYVPQQPRLLHASVADNIRFLREIDDEAVEQAGRLARIHDEIMAWPDGYETIVGPRVDAVSGGQQQRICLARALAGAAGGAVLDEPTSALDPHSERLIQESLEGLRAHMTLFIIAHRMSTLDICDRVMVILDGRLDAFDAYRGAPPGKTPTIDPPRRLPAGPRGNGCLEPSIAPGGASPRPRPPPVVTQR